MPPDPEARPSIKNARAAGLIHLVGRLHRTRCSNFFSDLVPQRAKSDKERIWNWKCNPNVRRGGPQQFPCAPCAYTSTQIVDQLCGHVGDNQYSDDDILNAGLQMISPRTKQRVYDALGNGGPAESTESLLTSVHRPLATPTRRHQTRPEEWSDSETHAMGSTTGIQPITVNTRPTPQDQSALIYSNNDGEFWDQSAIPNSSIIHNISVEYNDTENESSSPMDMVGIAPSSPNMSHNSPRSVNATQPQSGNTNLSIHSNQVNEETNSRFTTIEREIKQIHEHLRNLFTPLIGDQAKSMEMPELMAKAGTLIADLSKMRNQATVNTTNGAEAQAAVNNNTNTVKTYALAASNGIAPNKQTKRNIISDIIKKTIIPDTPHALKAIYVTNLERQAIGKIRSHLRLIGVKTTFVANIMFTRNATQFLVTENYVEEFLSIINDSGMRYQPNYDWTKEAERPGLNEEAIKESKEKLRAGLQTILKRMPESIQEKYAAVWQSELRDEVISITKPAAESTDAPEAADNEVKEGKRRRRQKKKQPATMDGIENTAPPTASAPQEVGSTSIGNLVHTPDDTGNEATQSTPSQHELESEPKQKSQARISTYLNTKRKDMSFNQSTTIPESRRARTVGEDASDSDTSILN
ncbi:hypothetical protein BDF22DRAFT_745019 [Syncephalis plumigaleata]|nr:hypothetical protein BDF22DRAFT_745019 [Syncephalis plumigaleata]